MLVFSYCKNHVIVAWFSFYNKEATPKGGFFLLP